MELNIDDIRIIIRKKEPAGFAFATSGRQADGFVLFTDGNATLIREGEEAEFLGKGDLALFRKGDRYRFSAQKPCAYVTAAFTFSPGSREALERLFKGTKAPEEVRKKILEAEAVWQRHRWDRPIAARILLLEIYRDLLSRTREGGSSSERIVAAAKDYLHVHYRENFSTAELAGSCGVSPSHLRAVFRKETGMSVTEFRNLLRIRQAKEMLSSGLFTVRETAEGLGYCDVYYFSKSFRQITGLPPARFRNRSQAPE